MWLRSATGRPSPRPTCMKLPSSPAAVLGLASLTLLWVLFRPDPHSTGWKWNRHTEARTPAPRTVSPTPATSPATPPAGASTQPGHASPRLVSTPPSLPQATAPEKAFQALVDWGQRWDGSIPAEQEGLALARQRREALREVIRRDPRRALELAVPEDARVRFPAAVLALLETRLEATGDLEVLCALPDPGVRHHDTLLPLRRFAVFGDTRLEAFVYGRRRGEPTLRNIPLRGIVLDGMMAVDEDPAPPGSVAAVGGAFLASGPALQSAATAGTKRLLFIRVDFSDLVGESFSTNRAAQLVQELHRFYQDNSYGRSGFRAIGSGSDVTPVFRLSRTAASYGNADASGALRTDARSAARAAGYNLANYDYDLVCMGSVPGFRWAGLGFIGAPGAWIRGTSSAGVVAHELGHNYGLLHANFWDTGGESILGAGTSIEYGDKFDTMGAANAGSYHFNARYKRLLGWLKQGEFTVATSNGTYRIYAHDQTNGAALSRGLQVFANAHTNYWLEFRQRFTSNPWLMSGAGLRWAGRGSESSLLLDATPGSSREKDDGALVLGRTFSDPASEIHLTPVAKGGSDPAWLDIMVQRGPFPDNHAPSLELTASATTGSTTTLFEFRATAVDADSDPIAYHWDFGDDTLGPNAPLTTHRWTSVGEYPVLCTASDTRGGVSRRRVVVRIGNPSTARATGQVRRDGEPVEGVKISAGAGLQTYTDSDGTYVLTGLSRGSVTLTAAREGTRFAPAGFQNPVDLSTSRDGLDFALSDPTGPRPVTLLPSGSSWRFWDKGSLPGSDWIRPEFDDASWDTGPAILGYGGDKETTLVSYGPDIGRKYVTTWFRRDFNVEDPSRLSDLRLGLLRDDGAVVYLNGEELLRANLPTGTITPQTLALTAVSGSAETTYFESPVAVTRLRAGTNVFAVEIHQASMSSSDIGFDLRLSGLHTPVPSPGVELTRPTPDQVFITPARIAMAATAGDFGSAEASLQHIAFLADGLEVGRATTAPFAAVWQGAAPGEHQILARATLADGTTADSPSVRIEVNDAELTPTLIARRSVWRYLDTGLLPAADWQTPEFDDRTWPSGPARLGYGEDGEATLVDFGPDPSRKRITTWFRHEFQLAGVSTITRLVCRLQRDDGAAVYLNGVELFRSGLRAGTLTPSLLALGDVGDEAEQSWFEREVDPAPLREGRNVVAVEVHQASASSSDLGFDLQLTGTRSALPPRPPALAAQRLGGGILVLDWPADAQEAGWRLESAPALDPGTTWLPVDVEPTPAEGRFEVRVPVPGEGPGRTLFYRLARPANR